jgi:hypothetical protein
MRNPYRKDEIPGGSKNLSGEVMANQAIAIKIALQGNGANTVHYTERHDVRNQFGLFSLVVEGLSILVILTRFHGVQRISG